MPATAVTMQLWLDATTAVADAILALGVLVDTDDTITEGEET